MQVKTGKDSLSISNNVIPAVARIADKNRISRWDITINVSGKE
ncbi:Uncharacterised protein [Salmonella enterica subsp. arizonae]|uniref:Uncharacterized protein n=1 Tax=Salmonella enterica subsp. arizonae TaxID=59203 RepID=A0A447R1D8_SALER|nr:Uncharacterised protein [Salmonella enterica subsp. arizonae]